MTEAPIKLPPGHTIPIRPNGEIAQLFDQEDVAHLNFRDTRPMTSPRLGGMSAEVCALEYVPWPRQTLLELGALSGCAIAAKADMLTAQVIVHSEQ